MVTDLESQRQVRMTQIIQRQTRAQRFHSAIGHENLLHIAGMAFHLAEASKFKLTAYHQVTQFGNQIYQMVAHFKLVREPLLVI